MKLICLIFFAIVCAACNVGSPTKYRPHFVVDQLEHYSIKLSSGEEMKLIEAESLSDKEIRLNDVVIQPEREKIADTIRLIGLEKIGFTKKEVHRSKFESINKLFCEKEHKQDMLSTTCIPFYRDVLIFRNKGKIVVAAKVCFDCGHHIISGTKYNTNSFGQSGDYEKLQNLLYENHSIRN